jgi:hypothetical protein
VQAESEEIAALVASPRRQLAFRTFAYIRIGLLLGELLVDLDAEPANRAEWVEKVLADAKNRERVIGEIHAVAREVAADPKLAQDEAVVDPGAKDRLRRLLSDA